MAWVALAFAIANGGRHRYRRRASADPLAPVALTKTPSLLASSPLMREPFVKQLRFRLDSIRFFTSHSALRLSQEVRAPACVHARVLWAAHGQEVHARDTVHLSLC